MHGVSVRAPFGDLVSKCSFWRTIRISLGVLALWAERLLTRVQGLKIEGVPLRAVARRCTKPLNPKPLSVVL